MSPKSSIQLFLALLLVVLASCARQEDTRWSTHAVFPVAYGSFGLESLVPDSLLQADDDNLLHLVIEENLTDFDLDSLVKIPDTTVVKSYVVDIAPLASLPVDPGVNVPIDAQDFNLETDLAQLREIVIKSGSIDYEIQNYIGGPLLVNFGLPGVSLDGVSFAIEDVIAPGSGGAPSIVGGSLDLAGYHFDLTGETGFEFNVLESELQVQVDPNSTETVTVFDQDSISIVVSFEEPVVSYARGYFGQHEYEINDPIDFEGFGAITASSIDIDAIDFSLEIENYTGVDAQIQINQLKAVNLTNVQAVELDNDQLGQPLNITRAQDFGGVVNPTSVSLEMDESTSNIDQFIEVMPEQLIMDVDISVNPLGDISGGNDFIYTDQALNAVLKADIPLCFSVENLQVRDTLDITIEEVPEAHGKVLVYITNYLPLGALFNLDVIDSNGEVLATVVADGELISASEVDGEVSPNESIIVAELDREAMSFLSPDNRLLMNLTFDSYGDEMVKIMGDQVIELKIVADVEGVIGYN